MRLASNEPIALSSNCDPSLSRSTPSALIIADAGGKIIHSNSWVNDFLGLGAEEIIGGSILAFFKKILHAEDYKRACAWVDDPFNVNSHLIYAFNGRGEKVPLEVAIYFVPGVESVFVARDVFAYTAWQKQNQRISRMRLISDLAEETADKVINPLTSLKGFIQLYQNNREDFPWDVLVQELANIERAVQEVLVFSHNYMGQPERIQINQIINDVYESVEYAAQRRSIWMEVYLDDKIGTIKANSHKIRTLTSNLVLYSLNKTGDGGILTIETRRKGNTVTLELVSGRNGLKSGLDTDKSETVNPRDNDLNLVICEHIVDSLGGYIQIKSREKAETIVTVTIPRQAG